MNNSNFGYDCRNSLDNCKFAPIFDEFKEITYINRYHNIFDPKVSEFVTSELMRADVEEKYNDRLLKQKDLKIQKQQKKSTNKIKKIKKEQN